MGTSKKRKKVKRRLGRARATAPKVEQEEEGGSSGMMGGMRSGFKGIVGTGGGKKKKESLLSKVLTYLLLAVALGLLIYRFAL